MEDSQIFNLWEILKKTNSVIKILVLSRTNYMKYSFITRKQTQKGINSKWQFSNHAKCCFITHWYTLASTPSFFTVGFLFSPAVFSSAIQHSKLSLVTFIKKCNSFRQKLLFPLWSFSLFIVTSHIQWSFHHFTRVSLPTHRAMQPTQTRYVGYSLAMIKLFPRDAHLISLEN